MARSALKPTLQNQDDPNRQAFCPLCRVVIRRIYQVENPPPYLGKAFNREGLVVKIQRQLVRVTGALDFDPEFLMILNNLDYTSVSASLRQPIYSLYYQVDLWRTNERMVMSPA